MFAGRTVGEGDDKANASTLDGRNQVGRSELVRVFRHVHVLHRVAMPFVDTHCPYTTNLASTQGMGLTMTGAQVYSAAQRCTRELGQPG
jgi:hypothetical protein